MARSDGHISRAPRSRVQRQVEDLRDAARLAMELTKRAQAARREYLDRFPMIGVLFGDLEDLATAVAVPIAETADELERDARAAGTWEAKL